MPTGEQSIPARLHPSGHWVGIIVQVGTGPDMLMVLDSGSPVSAVSPSMAREFHARDLLKPAATARYLRLTGLTAKEAPETVLPDLDVRILPRLGSLRIDGLLGLDFFREFERVCFHIGEARLSLDNA
jgi:hypothetical protein